MIKYVTMLRLPVRLREREFPLYDSTYYFLINISSYVSIFRSEKVIAQDGDERRFSLLEESLHILQTKERGISWVQSRCSQYEKER